MYAGLGFTHLHRSFFKVKKDVCIPIAVLLKIAHAIPQVGFNLKKKTDLFTKCARQCEWTEKTISCSFCIQTHTNIYMCIHIAAADIIIVTKQL